MSQDERTGILSILESMVDNDRDISILVMRTLPSPFREQYLIIRERNRSMVMTSLLSILRNTSPLQTQTFTMNIPVNIGSNWEDPVRVIPNLDQINAGIERNHNLTEPVTCSICQDEMGTNTTNVSRLRHCTHCFHHGCISDWFLMSSRCPVCRNDIRENPTQNNNPNPEDDEE